MTDATASLPPKFLPAKPAPSGTPGLEDESARIAEDGQFWSTEEGPTFGEFLDIINPLQHIPVVSTIYRAITGDEIGAGPRFIGGMIFGGPIGALAAGVAALFEEASGGDLGQHLAEMVEDVTGDGDDSPAKTAPAVAAAATSGAATPGAANIQQAALPAAGVNMDPAAQHLNRISLNPAAALGAARATPLGAAQNLSRSAGTSVAEAAQQDAGRKRTTQLPEGAKIFPAHPSATGASQIMQVPFGGNRPGSRISAPRAAAPVVHQPGQQAVQQAAPQVSNAVARSRRQQTDLMLAQWAAQQMSQQNADGGTERKAKSAAKNDDTAAPNAAPHPMLPPRNATPEWYAQAMDKALNQYRAGSNTLPAGVPALSLTR